MRLATLAGLTAIAAAATACDALKSATLRDGLFTRRTTLLRAEGKTVPLGPSEGANDVLPASIRIGPGRSCEIDARIARIRCSYRIERDSLFIDEAGERTVVALAGRVRGDTLDLDLLGAAIILQGPSDLRATLTFVRAGR